MPSSLIHEVASFCWSNNFLDVFTKFFKDYADDFIDAPEMCAGEHDLKYQELFLKYLQVYEDTLMSYLKTIDVSYEDFFLEVRQVQEDEQMKDPYLSQFVRCLLASTDYESFYRVMYKEGRKKAFLRKAEAATATMSLGAAEAKGGEAKAEKIRSEGKEVDGDFDEDYKSEGKSAYK
jgi:hypothetical protein